MGRQVVEHNPDSFCRRIVNIDKLARAFGEIHEKSRSRCQAAVTAAGQSIVESFLSPGRIFLGTQVAAIVLDTDSLIAASCPCSCVYYDAERTRAGD